MKKNAVHQSNDSNRSSAISGEYEQRLQKICNENKSNEN
jgi:hypothetical protein